MEWCVCLLCSFAVHYRNHALCVGQSAICKVSTPESAIHTCSRCDVLLRSASRSPPLACLLWRLMPMARAPTENHGRLRRLSERQQQTDHSGQAHKLGAHPAIPMTSPGAPLTSPPSCISMNRGAWMVSGPTCMLAALRKQISRLSIMPAQWNFPNRSNPRRSAASCSMTKPLAPAVQEMCFTCSRVQYCFTQHARAASRKT